MHDSILFHWLLLLSVCIAATMSPGPAFLLTLRNALGHDRRVGVATAVGLGIGIIPLILLTLFGMAALLAKSAVAFAAVRIVGAAYLLYLGVKSLTAKPPERAAETAQALPRLAPLDAFRQGIMTNLTNPKGWLYFMALFSQFVGPATPVPVKLLYGATSSIVEMTWFSIVATALTVPRIRAAFGRFMAVIQKICGVLFIGLALKLFAGQFMR